VETREAAKVIADVLQAELDLDEQHCLLGDQKWTMPKDDKLFVAVFDDSPRAIGSANFRNADWDEVQQVNTLHDIRIEIMSFGPEARTRKEEVIMALGSERARQTAERWNCQIAPVPASPLINASEAEVSARLLRYVVHFNLTRMHEKVVKSRGVDYFDKFNGATQDGSAKSPEVVTQ
jgi:hypothetical protein